MAKKDEKNKKSYIITSIISCLIGVLATFVFSEIPKQIKESYIKNPDVVMLGSGTVMQLLKDKYPDFYKKKNVHFFDGPSLTAIEVLINGKEKKESSIQMIAMSSTEIMEDSLKKMGWEEHTDNRLYEIFLGYDELNVILYPPDYKTAEKMNLENTEFIALENLYHHLTKDSDYDLYLTTENSGTKVEFKKYLDKIGKFNWKQDFKTYTLSDDVRSQIENSTKFSIILCSHYYKHANFKGFPIIYKNATLKRGLFFYFIADKSDLIPDKKVPRNFTLSEKNNFTKIIDAMGIYNKFLLKDSCEVRYNKIFKLMPIE